VNQPDLNIHCRFINMALTISYILMPDLDTVLVNIYLVDTVNPIPVDQHVYTHGGHLDIPVPS